MLQIKAILRVDFLGLYWNQIIEELNQWSKVMDIAKSLNYTLV